VTLALETEVEKRPVTRRLMMHPGVGPLTALAFELVIGTAQRFHCGKQIASYVGLVPSEADEVTTQSFPLRLAVRNVHPASHVLASSLLSEFVTASS
jgi:transposase